MAENATVVPVQEIMPEPEDWILTLADRGLSIEDRLALVAAEVGSVPKEDVNTDQGFKFRGMERILAAASPALAKYGIVPTPRVVSIVHGNMERGSNRNLWEHYIVEVEYDFRCHDGCLTAKVYAEGLDNADKGISKAMTVAFKTALLQVLHIADPEGIDPDSQHPVEERAPKQSSQSSSSSGRTGVAKKATPAKKAAPKQDAAKRASTPEDQLRPLADKHGPEFMAEVLTLVLAMNGVEDKGERDAVRSEFVEQFGKPVDMEPAQLEGAKAYVTLVVGMGPGTEVVKEDCDRWDRCAGDKGHDGACLDMNGKSAPEPIKHDYDTPEGGWVWDGDMSLCRICGNKDVREEGEKPEGYCADHLPF